MRSVIRRAWAPTLGCTKPAASRATGHGATGHGATGDGPRATGHGATCHGALPRRPPDDRPRVAIPGNRCHRYETYAQNPRIARVLYIRLARIHAPGRSQPGHMHKTRALRGLRTYVSRSARERAGDSGSRTRGRTRRRRVRGEGIRRRLPVERRGRDLNPRWPKDHNGFRDRPVRPLRHPSMYPGSRHRSGEGGIRTLDRALHPIPP